MISNLSLIIDVFGLCILILVCILSDTPSQILLSSPKKETSGIRSKSVDFIRGLAITGIVFIHVNSYYQYFGPGENASVLTLALSNLFRFGVPAFILSSGIFLKFTNWADYWRPKIFSLLIPYLGVSFLAACIKLQTLPSITEYLNGILLGSWCAPYYFVPLLVSLYLMFPFLKRILLKSNSKKVTLIFFFSALILNFLSNHIFRYFEIPLVKSIEPVLPTGFLFFFTFGLLAEQWFKEPKSFLRLAEKTKSSFFPYSFKRILLYGIFLYLLVLGIVGYFWKFDSSNHLIFYPLAMFLFLFFWAEDSREQKRHKRFISVFAFIGENSMGIFLLHPILIHWMHAWNPFHWGANFAWPLILVVGLINIVIPLLVWSFTSKLISRIFQLIRF
ncbi:MULTISPECIES: acyltransferase [Leptospira]|uniref:Acyltransferase n=3 Tax=Leptospira weilii TaxID=28184 RepID=A0A828YX87_9LEPT|nr:MULTISPECIES: acyltransferase [Leptospira]EMM71522.1 acyltransferase [Leptospira weilii str. 2006001855]EKR62626.1 acyltransferase [Leptospira weilii str. 2006001853]EMJ59995.1 acyltransferase [Leptospira sp. P2653]EMN91558.1 acyltransferase [Leptospira weilii str. UI 13098]MCL8266734.1 acyltransferase [Leptospira weilii]